MNVIITTVHRGVFFGQLVKDESPDEVELKNAQMCVSWPAESKGLLGLASTGPTAKARITAAAPSLRLHSVTAIIECTDAAAAKWAQAPWS